MTRIRNVEREDLETLFALDQRCFRSGIAWSRSELRHFLFQPNAISVIAEDKAGTILGFAIAELYSEEDRRIAHLGTIDVDPEQRRQGVGNKLMETLYSEFRKLRMDLVRLEVAADNSAAQDFYKQQKFMETGRIPGFYMGTLDALIMERPLFYSGHDC